MSLKKTHLENIYNKYNKREFIHPDPLEFIYNYTTSSDREITGLIAASLAYGKVAQILKSVKKVLNKMNPSPFLFLKNTSNSQIGKAFSTFKHRFTTGDDLSNFLIELKNMLNTYGSVGKYFESIHKKENPNILPLLCEFTSNFSSARSLIPDAAKGSACKRLNLFLRWMVRRDEVDPGGWNAISPAKLIVPLDTHMHRIALSFSLTKRKNANIETALEITKAFAQFSPRDPVKYDFALTRFGIRDELKHIRILA